MQTVQSKILCSYDKKIFKIFYLMKAFVLCRVHINTSMSQSFGLRVNAMRIKQFFHCIVNTFTSSEQFNNDVSSDVT